MLTVLIDLAFGAIGFGALVSLADSWSGLRAAQHALRKDRLAGTPMVTIRFRILNTGAAPQAQDPAARIHVLPARRRSAALTPALRAAA